LLTAGSLNGAGSHLQRRIATDRAAYLAASLAHDSRGGVNPAGLFLALHAGVKFRCPPPLSRRPHHSACNFRAPEK